MQLHAFWAEDYRWECMRPWWKEFGCNVRRISVSLGLDSVYRQRKWSIELVVVVPPRCGRGHINKSGRYPYVRVDNMHTLWRCRRFKSLEASARLAKKPKLTARWKRLLEPRGHARV